MRELRLFRDEYFENGFTLIARRHGKGGKDVPKGIFQFPCSKDKPTWFFEQWHSHHCIVKERYETDPYTLANCAKEMKYDPEKKIISLRLNARNEYEGKGHLDKRVLWPHLLLEQCMVEKFDEYSEEEKPFYSADAKKFVWELSLRMTDFKDTTNPEGINACQFLAYFYLTMKDESGFVYFGMAPFDNREPMEKYWALDVEGRAMIYTLSTADTFCGIENAFKGNSKDIKLNEWRDICVDMTPYIDKAIQRINDENIFGRKVSRNDMYIRGVNIGFEIHGNYDCTVEIRKHNLVSYI